MRVRSLEMADYYRGDSRSSATALRDGWFYPGDVGSVRADGAIVVVGRIEDMLRAVLGVADCAVFVAAGPEGTAVVCTAVVRTEQHHQTDLAERLRAAVPRLPDLHVTFTNAVPRNDSGKPDLRRLRALAAAAQSSPG